MTKLLLVGALALAGCGRGQFGGGEVAHDAAPAGDTAPLVSTTPPPVACESLKIATLDEVESKIFARRCGTPPVAGVDCHGSVFPPRGLDTPGAIRGALVDKNAESSCKSDKYINSADITKSFILAKVLAPTDMVDCPSGGAGQGGLRMPDQGIKPKPDLLSADERGCLMWYVSEIVKQP
jgi:hypothetical protein